ncbi:MAG: hypothetical protein ACI39E_04150, partial [Acutalibacteraceae bacterium]
SEGAKGTGAASNLSSEGAKGTGAASNLSSEGAAGKAARQSIFPLFKATQHSGYTKVSPV